MTLARHRPIVARPTPVCSLAAPPVSLSLRWRVHQGAEALDTRIAALKSPRAGSLRDRAVVAAAAFSEETAALPAASDVRAALAMLSRRYVLRSSQEGQRQIALIAAAAAAMEGRQVHLIHPHAAHAKLNVEAFSPLFARLGLEIAFLDEDADLDMRAEAYGADIVLASANRLTRDLLRERILHGQKSRGARGAISRLAMRQGGDKVIWPDAVTGIVLDADLMFFDPPRPVAVADELEREKGRVLADQAFLLISGLESETHYVIDTATRRIRLTERGRDRIDTYATLFGDAWLDSAWCETTVLAAITVRDLFAPDSDYVVDASGIRLTRVQAKGVDGPSIPDLVAAKEALPSKRGELHLADIRRLMGSYAVLGATGLAVPGLKQELATAFQLRRFARIPPPARPIPAEFFSSGKEAAQHLLRRLVSLTGPVTLWTPVAMDTAALGLAEPPVVGADIFAASPTSAHLVQFGAAPAHWEERLSQLAPGLKIDRFVSAADPWFELLPPDAEARTAFAARPEQTTYATAQAAEALLRHKKRMAALASDSFFDRILAFTGDMGW